MKIWKKKYLTLFLAVALGTSMTAFAACDGMGVGAQSGQGEQGEQGGSVSVDASASMDESSAEDSSLEESSDNQQSESKDEDSSITSDDKDNSNDEQQKPEDKPDESAKTVTQTEWEDAFAIKNYSLNIKQMRAGEIENNADYHFDQDGNKYAVTYEKEKGVELYVETIEGFEEYNRYEKNEKTGKWEKIFVSGEHNYSEMYFALNVFNKAFGKRFNEFVYNEEKGIYSIEEISVEEITGGGMNFDKVEISFNNKRLEAVVFFWTNESGSYLMSNTFSNWGEISITLPEAKEEVHSITEAEWQETLTATNYTARCEMWNDSSASAPLNIKRETNKYYMLAGAEEYIVETGETNTYYRWNKETKSWEKDNSQSSSQHLIAEQMRAALSGKYNTFSYNEETGLYEAADVTLTVMGQETPLKKVTVSFENKNLSELYCESESGKMRFAYSQYGDTMVEFIEKETTEDDGFGSTDKETTENEDFGVIDKALQAKEE
jgi:hypothetical protein